MTIKYPASPSLLKAPPSTPIRTTTTYAPSIDDELAKVTNDCLTMGPSIVKDISNISFIFPPRHKLHPGLYINTAETIEQSNTSIVTEAVTKSLLKFHLTSMRFDFSEQKERSNNTGTVDTPTNCGVPGFPDFPDCWNGSPSTPKASNRQSNTINTSSSSKRRSKSNSKGRHNQKCHRRINRNAVNFPFVLTTSSLSPPKDTMKQRRNADERNLRRIAKILQIKDRRRRKRDMGEICRGLAAIKW